MTVFDELNRDAAWTIADYVCGGFNAREPHEPQPASARDVLGLLDSDTLAAAVVLRSPLQRGEFEDFFADVLLVPLKALTSTIDSSDSECPRPRDVARDIRLILVAADVVARGVQAYSREREASPWWPPACEVPYREAAIHIAAMVASTGTEPPRISAEHANALGFQVYCRRCFDALGDSGDSGDFRVVVDDCAPAIIVRGKREALAHVYEARALRHLALHDGFHPQAKLIEVADPPTKGPHQRVSRPRDWFKRSTSDVFRRLTETRGSLGIAFKPPI